MLGYPLLLLRNLTTGEDDQGASPNPLANKIIQGEGKHFSSSTCLIGRVLASVRI